MVKNKKLLFTLVIYFILFYTAWAGFGWLIANHFFDWTGNNEIVIQIIRAGIVKNLVWTLPAFILIKHFESDCYIGLKEMFTTKIRLLDILPVTSPPAFGRYELKSLVNASVPGHNGRNGFSRLAFECYRKKCRYRMETMGCNIYKCCSVFDDTFSNMAL